MSERAVCLNGKPGDEHRLRRRNPPDRRPRARRGLLFPGPPPHTLAGPGNRTARPGGVQARFAVDDATAHTRFRSGENAHESSSTRASARLEAVAPAVGRGGGQPGAGAARRRRSGGRPAARGLPRRSRRLQPRCRHHAKRGPPSAAARSVALFLRRGQSSASGRALRQGRGRARGTRRADHRAEQGSRLRRTRQAAGPPHRRLRGAARRARDRAHRLPARLAAREPHTQGAGGRSRACLSPSRGGAARALLLRDAAGARWRRRTGRARGEPRPHARADQPGPAGRQPIRPDRRDSPSLPPRRARGHRTGRRQVRGHPGAHPEGRRQRLPAQGFRNRGGLLPGHAEHEHDRIPAPDPGFGDPAFPDRPVQPAPPVRSRRAAPRARPPRPYPPRGEHRRCRSLQAHQRHPRRPGGRRRTAGDRAPAGVDLAG